MNEAVLTMAGLAALAMLPLLLRHTKRVSRMDPFLQWFHSGGKLLKDYDEERKMIDKYMK